MTTPATPRRAGPFAGTGAPASHPFSFKVFSADEVRVVITDAAGAESDAVEGSYTVTVNADQVNAPGGSVTRAVPVGYQLTVLGNVKYEQTLALPLGGNYDPGNTEKALDRIVFMIQQLAEQVVRAVKTPVATAAEATADFLLNLLRESASSAADSAASASGSAAAAAGSASAAATSAASAAGSASAAAGSASAAATSAANAASAATSAASEVLVAALPAVGDTKYSYQPGDHGRWLLLTGPLRTIGNAGSGATARAHADTFALFSLLWNLHDDAVSVYSPDGFVTPRGASAAADFAAGLRIDLPNESGLVSKGHHGGNGLMTTNITRHLGTVELDEVKRHKHQAWTWGPTGDGEIDSDFQAGRAEILRDTTETGGDENLVRNRSKNVFIFLGP